MSNLEPCYRVPGTEGHYASYDIAVAAADAIGSYVIRPVWCTCMKLPYKVMPDQKGWRFYEIKDLHE